LRSLGLIRDKHLKLLLTIQNLLKHVKMGLFVSVLTLLPACVSSSWVRQTASGLPIEAVHSESGAIMSFRAHETPDRLYVFGRAKTHQLKRPMHVDVQLIGPNGGVVAQRTDGLDTPHHPRSSPGRHEKELYVASFPLSEARQAVKIRVVYRESAHDNS
jgi:hypothetical protein